jgi:Tfp pilus assembly protein PilF
MARFIRARCLSYLLLTSIFACGLTHGSEKQIKYNSTSVSDRIERGKAYLAEGMYEKAEQEFNTAIEMDSTCAQAYLLSALTVRKQKKPDLKKALSLVEKAVGIAPDDGAVRLNLAEVYTEMGSDDKAEREFKNAINLSRDDAILVSAHLGLMAVYEKKGDAEGAGREYDAAKAIFPGVDEIIKRAEIARLSPSPVYAGSPASQEGSYHPFLEDRIKHAEEAIDKT